MIRLDVCRRIRLPHEHARNLIQLEYLLNFSMLATLFTCFRHKYVPTRLTQRAEVFVSPVLPTACGAATRFGSPSAPVCRSDQSEPKMPGNCFLQTEGGSSPLITADSPGNVPWFFLVKVGVSE